MRLKPIEMRQQPTEFERMVAEWSTLRLSFEIYMIENNLSPYSRRQRERIKDLATKLNVEPYKFDETPYMPNP